MGGTRKANQCHVKLVMLKVFTESQHCSRVHPDTELPQFGRIKPGG